MSKTVNVSVSLNEVGGNPHRLIRKFIKKCKKERIIEDYRDRRFYEKPSVKKRRDKKRKLRNARKAEAERNRSKG
tara:strand:- start:1062 stop:1286 length:225 start_codon:yes stop_codon:yes gene_type:complete